jgi:mannose-6-phosphate isomerase-like protein (cupin superfamily)
MYLASLARLPAEPISHNPAILKRVLLRNGQIDGVTQFAEARFAPGEIAGSHTHPDMSEVFLVQSGHGTAVVNGTANQLGPGDCIAIQPGEAHSFENTGHEPWVLVYFGVVTARGGRA